MSKNNLTEADYQAAAAALGFDPGPIDGIWGRKTKAAATALGEAIVLRRMASQ